MATKGRVCRSLIVSRISASPLSCTVRALIAFLKPLDEGLGRGQFREVAQGVRVFQFHRTVKQFSLHEGFDLAVQHVVAADQAQVLHDRLREIADHAAIVGDARRVQDRGMRDLARGDVLEDDLPLFFLAELQVGHALMPHCARRSRSLRFLYSR